MLITASFEVKASPNDSSISNQTSHQRSNMTAVMLAQHTPRIELNSNYSLGQNSVSLYGQHSEVRLNSSSFLALPGLALFVLFFWWKMRALFTTKQTIQTLPLENSHNTLSSNTQHHASLPVASDLSIEIEVEMVTATASNTTEEAILEAEAIVEDKPQEIIPDIEDMDVYALYDKIVKTTDEKNQTIQLDELKRALQSCDNLEDKLELLHTELNRQSILDIIIRTNDERTTREMITCFTNTPSIINTTYKAIKCFEVLRNSDKHGGLLVGPYKSYITHILCLLSNKGSGQATDEVENAKITFDQLYGLISKSSEFLEEALNPSEQTALPGTPSPIKSKKYTIVNQISLDLLSACNSYEKKPMNGNTIITTLATEIKLNIDKSIEAAPSNKPTLFKRKTSKPAPDNSLYNNFTALLNGLENNRTELASGATLSFSRSF